jgi:purine-nucleoside phosphorylase
MLKKIKATANFLKERFKASPEVGVILGTGLGGLVKEIEIIDSIPYKEIPDFPVSTVDGHAGRLIYGRLGNRRILAMQGRFHYYEGYTMKEVTFPVRVMKFVGVTHLFVSNASGGLNPDWQVGDIVIISDHINFLPENPLYGANDSELGSRFPDMSKVYDEHLRNKARLIALENNIPLREGVYISVQGPAYETPAEYKMFRLLGGDIIGMSTVPEVIVAKHMGLSIFGISIITDSGVPGQIVEISHEEVQHAAMNAEPDMTLIMRKLIESI